MLIQGDDNLENSDWIKSQTWDLPYENLEQYLRNYAPAEQQTAVRHLMELPAFKAAPPVFRVEAEMFVAGSALKFVNGEFIVKFDDTQERDENGRWTSTGDTGGASEFPAAKEDAAFERLRNAEKVYEKLRDEIVVIEDGEGRGMIDRINSSPEAVAASDEYMAANAAAFGSYVYGNVWQGEAVLTTEAQWLANNFSMVDENGNPRDPNSYRQGQTEYLTKLRDEYVVPDDKTLRMNASLRDGRSSTKADRLDEWVNSSTVTSPVVLYRGATMSPEQIDNLQPGFSYVDKGYQSSGSKESTASGYLSIRQQSDETSGFISQPVMMRYVVEPNTHVVPAGYDEYVVQRNTTNTVIGRNDVDGVTYITMGVRGNG